MPGFHGARTANPRLYDRAHRQTRTTLLEQLQQRGTGTCAEVECVERSRLITADMDLALCHDRKTGQTRGLGHARCNRVEAARYAQQRSAESRKRSRGVTTMRAARPATPQPPPMRW